MKGFLDFLPGHSLLHKLHPLAKLFIAIAICASAFVSSSYICLASLIVLNLILGIAGDAGCPKGEEKPGVFKRTRGLFKGLLKVSVFLFVLQILLIRGGEPVITIGNFALTDKGLNNGALLVLRLIAATLPLSIMITVTNLSDLSNVLVNNLHMPYKYAYTFTTAIRFIPVFGNEMNNIMEAQISRGVDFDTKNPIKKIALVLPLCVPLLLSSVRKIDSTAIATELRGFHLRKAGCAAKDYRFSAKDCFAVVFGLLVIGAAVVAKIFAII
jgi:energy-coupling factor transport system permease protein